MATTTKPKPRAKKRVAPPEPAKLNLPPGTKPSAVLGRDRVRPSLCHPYVVQHNGHRELVATDSYTMAWFRVGDTTPLGPLHREALKQIENGADHALTEGKVTIKLDDKATADYTAPQIALPSFVDKPLEFEWPEKETVSIVFNPELLAAIVRALGKRARTGVRLDIRVKDGTTLQAIRVRPDYARDGDPEAVLMPKRLNA